MKRLVYASIKNMHGKVNESDYRTGYLYLLKHGIGPGTLPKDVAVLKSMDLPHGFTAVWLDSVLTTDELKEFDIPSETQINRRLADLGYEINDQRELVPIETSTDIECAAQPVKYTIKSVSDEGVYYLVKDWRRNKELWVDKRKMDNNPQFWFTSSGKATQSLKTLLNYMDDYRTDAFYVVDTDGNETPLSIDTLGLDPVDEDLEFTTDITCSNSAFEDAYVQIMNILDATAKSGKSLTSADKNRLDSLLQSLGSDIADIADANDCGDCTTWDELVGAIKGLFDSGDRVPVDSATSIDATTESTGWRNVGDVDPYEFGRFIKDNGDDTYSILMIDPGFEDDYYYAMWLTFDMWDVDNGWMKDRLIEVADYMGYDSVEAYKQDVGIDGIIFGCIDYFRPENFNPIYLGDSYEVPKAIVEDALDSIGF